MKFENLKIEFEKYCTVDVIASSFEDKMKKLVAEIASFLGEPEPYEIERKYLIEYPDIK